MSFHESKLPGFSQNFSSISLHHKKPESIGYPWVFWSESEGCENNSTSVDVGTPINIHDKIISALSNMYLHGLCVGQFWTPVTIGGRRLLSTSAQPFSITPLSKELAKYRLNSEKYKYNIDDANNKVDIEPDQMIKSGGPAIAFLNRRTSIMTKLQGFLSESDNYYGLNFSVMSKLPSELDNDDDDEGLNFSVMIPICLPSQSNCIGVLQFTSVHSIYSLADFINDRVKEIKEVGLDVFYVQHLIPYTTINSLKVVKEEIEEALKVVCESHNLALAQVWIPYEDKNNVPFSHALEDTQTEQLLAIKLAGYLYSETGDGINDFEPYFRCFDTTPRGIGDKLLLVTLQDYESRYISKLCSDMLVYWGGDDFDLISAFAICLRSNVTSDINYVFEFIWTKDSSYSNYVAFLEAILITLKRCLPRFKFASSAELGDELNVIDVEKSKDDIPEKFKIFQEKRSSLMPEAREEAKRTMVVDYIAHSEVTCKTTPKVLPREVIEKQFGNTMKDAAKNLKVSESTLKRKLRKLGIREWQGPNFVKRNTNDSSVIQIDRNEDDNGAIQEPSTVNINQNNLTIKAEHADDMIKFRLPIMQATFETVQKEIGMKFNLSPGTYKLKYRDEVGDWILLRSDEEISYCIESSRKSYPNEVRLRVILTVYATHGRL
ncbi:hypothetical protein M8C21_029880 [Ambrosia artemisiifolia]|uniref:PB1 domain-containing protein n=1 Tax=Ambrosia artemisiifolia TaxID=4212 RepID=A0AAD5BX26_AMBAR|nr:hypothetical protein M8C21_029880 [Ambrosia artemisiifolia]